MGVEFESRNIFGKQVPDDTQRDSAMEDSALGFVFAKTLREAKKRVLKLTSKRKPLRKGSINHL